MTRTAIERRTLLGMTLLAAASLPLPARALDASAVVAPIRQLCGGLLAVMHAGQATPFARRFDLLAPAVENAFDLDAILQVSVGLSWATLPPDQKAMLRAAFRRYTIASYVNSFDDYAGQRFDISAELRSLPNGEQVVSTRIVPRSGDSHVLDYVMRQVPQGWRAVDVLLDGTISRVAVQRSDFRSLLSRGGASALAKSLQAKTADLSGGSS
ncbi:MAG TPA: ABC transporter substrate-binding protein [Acetobacteraceae bacterium]|nr:ABC transporter substrate-binding protein [Acetobacteraceae bacterium]